MTLPRLLRPLSALAGLACAAHAPGADNRVAVIATASETYRLGRVDAAGQTRPETYVFMEGTRTEGVTRNGSLERMTFPQLAGLLAPELARQQYLPAAAAAAADLLLIVHWGTTTPRETDDRLRARDTISVDQNSPTGREDLRAEQMRQGSIMAGASPGLGPLLEMGRKNIETLLRQEELERETDAQGDLGRQVRNARLLGYNQRLRRKETAVHADAEEMTMREHIGGERYFIIVRAYDLKAGPDPAGRPREPVWVLHANIGAPGHDFATALNLMGTAAGGHFGQTLDALAVIRPPRREGTVRMAPLNIEGVVPPGAKP